MPKSGAQKMGFDVFKFYEMDPRAGLAFYPHNNNQFRY